jgi:nicotinate (nicotinamide) nucleotide adenylyltransferase
MKIAIGGSAANPAHYGHRYLMEKVSRLQLFDKIEWIISGNRPDKPEMPPAYMRWQMTKLLICNPQVEITYEGAEAIPTIDVIRQKQKQFPTAKITFFCGSDHFIAREKYAGACDIEEFWDEGQWLMNNQHFLIIPRKGTEQSIMRYPKNFTLLDAKTPEISSTLIRQNVIAKRSNLAFTSQAVIDYIKENQLYV